MAAGAAGTAVRDSRQVAAAVKDSRQGLQWQHSGAAGAAGTDSRQEQQAESEGAAGATRAARGSRGSGQGQQAGAASVGDYFPVSQNKQARLITIAYYR